jgi:hypothetical protein
MGNALMAVGKATGTAVQWTTLAWIAGAALAAAVIITVIVLVSRRPKSMEDGMLEFSRSLQAVAPLHRSSSRPAGQADGNRRAASTSRPLKPQRQRPQRARTGETEAV